MQKSIWRAALLGSIVLFGACSEPQAVLNANSDSMGEQVSETAMNGEKMATLIQRFDEDAVVAANRITFKVRERDVMVVYDNDADRMRIMSPIVQAAAVPEEIYERMLQANFDAVLDSRYAIANEIVWSVFIHKMSSLAEDDFLSGIAQTYTAAETFGGAYTSGAIVFGGGDTTSLHEELLEEIENRPRKEDQGI